MRRIALWIWELPWPALVRRKAEAIINLGWLQRLVVPRFFVGVVGLIENERGDLLLLRHTYRNDYPWGLPSGFLERAEQPSDALKREIEEEAGFRVEVSPVRQVYVDAKRPLVNIIFTGTFRGGDFVSSTEVSAARFFARDALPALLPEQYRLVQAFLRQEL